MMLSVTQTTHHLAKLINVHICKCVHYILFLTHTFIEIILQKIYMFLLLPTHFRCNTLTAIIVRQINWRESSSSLKSIFWHSTTLKMEEIRSSETSGTTQRTTRRHIPEEDTLQVVAWLPYLTVQNHQCN
jgi:hypothetical protein